MLCLECGHLNGPYEELCENCGKPLEDRSLEVPFMTDKLDELRQAVEKVKSREISSGEFRDLLKTLENKYKNTLDEISKMDLPPDIASEISEELSVGTDGLKLYIEAVREMGAFLDTRDPVYLDRGMAMATDANKRLNEALRKNWENFRNIQNTTEEFLRMQSGI